MTGDSGFRVEPGMTGISGFRIPDGIIGTGRSGMTGVGLPQLEYEIRNDEYVSFR